MSAGEDLLFARMATWQGSEPWGSVLDAGTGDHSLNWLLTQDTERWTAVTGDESRAESMRQRFGARIRPADRLIAGNWANPEFLAQERFDVVLADYLIGAMDGFAPYYQDQILGRLRPHVKRALYLVGLDPIIHERPRDAGAALIAEVARLRDACILLAGHRCYREFPMEWVARHLERAGFKVAEQARIPILYGPRFIQGQLGVARRKLPLMRDKALADTMQRHIASLERQALEHVRRHGRIRFGHDYVMKAVPEDGGHV